VIAACRRLKESGYTIALDDFGMNDSREALTDVADIIKVDLRETSPALRMLTAVSQSELDVREIGNLVSGKASCYLCCAI
jgi:c-di-GMP-related signal transduction protein